MERGPKTSQSVGLFSLLVETTRRSFGVDQSSADFSDCGWNCIKDAYDDSDCPTNSYTKCLCEDSFARAEASRCISDQCRPQDLTQLSSAINGCGGGAPATPVVSDTTPGPPSSGATIGVDTPTRNSTPTHTTTPSLTSSPESTSIDVGTESSQAVPKAATPSGSSTTVDAAESSDTAFSSTSSRTHTGSTSSSSAPSSVTPPPVSIVSYTTRTPDTSGRPPSAHSQVGSLTTLSPGTSTDTPTRRPSSTVIYLSTVLGVLLVFVLIVALSLCVRRRRRRRRQSSESPSHRLSEPNSDTEGRDDTLRAANTDGKETVDGDAGGETGALKAAPPLVPNRASHPPTIAGVLAIAGSSSVDVTTEGGWAGWTRSSEGGTSWSSQARLAGDVYGPEDRQSRRTLYTVSISTPTISTSTGAAGGTPGHDPAHRILEVPQRALGDAHLATEPEKSLVKDDDRQQALISDGDDRTTPSSATRASDSARGTGADPRFCQNVQPSSGGQRSRLVAVLMEVSEPEDGEQDQPPPYRPRPGDEA